MKQGETPLEGLARPRGPGMYDFAEDITFRGMGDERAEALRRRPIGAAPAGATAAGHRRAQGIAAVRRRHRRTSAGLVNARGAGLEHQRAGARAQHLACRAPIHQLVRGPGRSRGGNACNAYISTLTVGRSATIVKPISSHCAPGSRQSPLLGPVHPRRQRSNSRPNLARVGTVARG